jgi:outer membrane lipoprotein LolB
VTVAGRAAAALSTTAAVLAVVSSAGCVSRAPLDAATSADVLTGRMSVQVAATDGVAPRNLSAAFELSGSAEQGRLDLNTPFGSTLARAVWRPGSVTLDTPQGQTRHASLDDLTRDMVGEVLPVPALFDWLRGRPWRSAASTATSAPAPVGFAQLGWTVDLSQFDHARIQARRDAAPAVTVQVKLDTP